MSGMALKIIFDIVGVSNSNFSKDTTTRQSVIGHVVYICVLLGSNQHANTIAHQTDLYNANAKQIPNAYSVGNKIKIDATSKQIKNRCKLSLTGADPVR
jgi:hypothetical protein